MQVSGSTRHLVDILARLHRLAFLCILAAVTLVCFIVGVALGEAYPLRRPSAPAVPVVKVRQVLVPWPGDRQPRAKFEPLAVIVSRDPSPPPVEPLIPPQPKVHHAAAHKKKPPAANRGPVVVQRDWTARGF